MITLDTRPFERHDMNVKRAIDRVRRHEFVPSFYRDHAYDDTPLPIGHGQTISQPSLVAYMTELLDLRPGDKVLEIGTGSGYQTAILAELGYGEVYSVEIIPELAEAAAARLQALGYSHLHLKRGDGYVGWADFAPYDAIIVTAASDRLPPALVEQLAEGGRLVIPIGPRDDCQTLWRFVKRGKELLASDMAMVAFVPLVRNVDGPAQGLPHSGIERE
jgi:protein-L-isoaspartate(D-aspartate) O-methyltransferase